MDYYGQLDFTKLCRLWRGHKELFTMVDFKDGKHAMLKVNFNERQQADDHGNTHYMQAACKKDQRKDGLDYYIGSQFKPSQHNAAAPAATTSATAPQSDNDLPF